MSDPFRALDSTYSQVWQRLARGTKDRRAATRTVTLATIGPQGPEARSVILRAVDQSAATLEIHTDRRTGKVSQLNADPRAALHVWDAKANLQIRMRCSAVLSHGDNARWDRIPPQAQRVYGGSPAPGHPLEHADEHDPSADQVQFTVIMLHVEDIETLYLGPDRHRRARFRATDDWKGQWLAP